MWFPREDSVPWAVSDQLKSTEWYLDLEQKCSLTAAECPMSPPWPKTRLRCRASRNQTLVCCGGDAHLDSEQLVRRVRRLQCLLEDSLELFLLLGSHIQMRRG